MSLQSLQYSRGSLKVLDQLLLPHESVYVDVLNTQGAWAVIRSMQVRGAPLIAITAALGLAVDVHNRRGEFASDKTAAADFLLSSMEYLRTSRPTAVNLFTAMDELTQLVQEEAKNEAQTAEGLVETFVAAAEKIFQDDIATNRAIGRHGAERILEIVQRDKVRVLTICNTGSLATADYGTALGVVRALNDIGRLEHVYACETRPYNQGARLTAYEIVQDGLPGTLITDSMASALMAVKGVDVVVVGADRIAANGDTANKIGTYQLAIAAKYHNVPFFTAAPTTTIDLSMASGAEIHVEERPAVELTSIFGQKIAPDGIKVWNPSFDVTPCALIRGVITELGVAEPTVLDPQDGSRNADPIISLAPFIAARLSLVKNPISLRTLTERTAAAAQPVAVPVGYDRLGEEKIGAYVLHQPSLVRRLGLTEEDLHAARTQKDAVSSLLKISEVGDGNLNFVYIIEGKEGKKIVIKQALPFVRCVGESWPLTLRRAFFEYSALVKQREMAGGALVPEVFLFDQAKCVIAMEYIAPPNILMRKHLIVGERAGIAQAATHLGNFLAKTLFRSSALALSGTVFREQVAFWSENASMCALSEKVIFTDPYTPGAALNHWNEPHLDAYVRTMQKLDATLKLAAAYHKRVFLTSTQALLHADLHTGSVMASEKETVVIDPEFAFYGPMGFDLGALLANLYLSFFAHSAQEDAAQSESYCRWLLAQIETMYATFEREFLSLWNAQRESKEGGEGELYARDVYSQEEHERAQKEFLQSVWRDALGFAGSKMIRRVVGVAHVADIESIEDKEVRAKAEKRALLFGRECVLASYLHKTQQSGWRSVEEVNASLALTLAVSEPAETWPLSE